MFVIRSEQLEVLAAASESSFRDWLAETLRSDGRSAELPRLRDEVDALLERASIYGIFLRDDQLRFIGLAAQRGPNFDAEPPAAEILRDPYRSGSDKLTALEAVED